MDDTQLQTLAETIGRTYGYKRMDASFAAFADFKMKWTRGYDHMVLEVSDYLRDAPSEVVDGLLRSAIAKTRGQDADDTSAKRWLANGGVHSKVDIYIARQMRGRGTEDPCALDHADAIMRELDPVLSTRPAHVIACRGRGGMNAYFDVLAIGTSDDTADVLENLARAGRIIRDGRGQRWPCRRTRGSAVRSRSASGRPSPRSTRTRPTYTSRR